MLDIIKDLHLTVQNIVAGIALISQNPCENESFIWEIKNGSNQPTVTISYKMSSKNDFAMSKKESYRACPENGHNKGKSLPFFEDRTELQSNEHSFIMENREATSFRQSATHCKLNMPSSSSVNCHEESKFSHEIFEPQVCVRIQKDTAVEFNELGLNDPPEEENNDEGSRNVTRSENLISSNDEMLMRPSFSSERSESYLLSSENNSVSFDPTIKIKEEKTDFESYYCDGEVTEETSDEFQSCEDGQKNIDCSLISRNSVHKNNPEGKEVSKIDCENNFKELMENNGNHSNQMMCDVKERNLISSIKENGGHLLSISSKEMLMNCSDVDVFTPEIILKTEMPQNEDAPNFMKGEGDIPRPQDSNYICPFIIRDDSNTKSFKCISCNKCFRQKRDLLFHIRLHTGEQPFPCDFCGKCFRDAIDKKRHERIHTGEKPYACSYCNKCFARNHHKTRHERTHTGEKPYACRYCAKRFTQIGSMKTHEKTACKKRRHAYRKDDMLYE